MVLNTPLGFLDSRQQLRVPLLRAEYTNRHSEDRVRTDTDLPTNGETVAIGRRIDTRYAVRDTDDRSRIGPKRSARLPSRRPRRREPASERTPSATARTASDVNLELGKTAQIIIGFGFLFGMPLLLLGSGVAIWWRRRNR